MFHKASFFLYSSAVQKVQKTEPKKNVVFCSELQECAEIILGKCYSFTFCNSINLMNETFIAVAIKLIYCPVMK